MREMTTAEVRTFIGEKDLGRLGVAYMSSGIPRPYVVPINYLYASNEGEFGHVYSHTLPGRKLDYMRQNLAVWSRKRGGS